MLFLSFIVATCTADDPLKQKVQPRIDSYDDILRPPPPPPNLANMRLPFMNSNQRFHRTNQFRQPHLMRQPAYPQQERYPLNSWKEPQSEPSFLQKVSSWFFPGDSNSAPATYGPPSHEPPPNFAPPIRLQSAQIIQHNQNSHNNNNQNQHNQNQNHYNQNQNQHNQNQQKKKECNLCNQFPWVPVIRYPNAAIGILNHDKQPSKLLQPPENGYIPPNDIITGPPAPGKPLGYDLKPPITNSYGAPIPPNSYDSPLPVTNDGGESPLLTPNKKPYNPNLDAEEFGNHGGRYPNKDTIENLESNNVPLVSKPNQENPKYNRSVNRFNTRPPGVHVLQPIPFPNLSPVQIPPIFNARPFKTGKKYNQDSFASSTQHPIRTNNNPSNYQSTTNYQLLPSVSLAEFTSSIDYPISIIQSPLVEIDATNSDNGGKKGNAHKDNVVDSNNINLNKNPIVVQNDSLTFDSYSAASGGNDLNTNQESVNFVTRDTNKSERPFLPTPVPLESNSNRNIVHSLTPISYSFIDQTFSSGDKPDVYPTSTPPNFYNEHNTNYIDHSTATNTFRPYSANTLQSLDSPLLYLKPSVPHKESKLFRQIEEKTTIRPVTEKLVSNVYQYSTPVPSQVTSASTNTGFRYLEHNSVEGRWPPPLEPFTEKTTIKPKRIQIIIPYTTKNQPSPFKFSGNDVASPSGWVPVIVDIDRNYGRKVPSSTAEQNTVGDVYTTNSLSDYHESSESKIITSAAQNEITTTVFETSSPKPKKPKPTDLIEPIKNNKISFDVKKLQQNIDEWTSLEYSKIFKRQQKASTTSHLKRSKKIPDEYLTTTPAQVQDSQVFLSKINDLNASLLDSESASSIQHTYETNLYNDSLVPSINNSIYQRATAKEPTRTYYTTNGQYKTTMKIETTTTPPKTTTKPAWEKIQTSISPLTKEKVYVVTPQPWHVVNSSFSFNNFDTNDSNVNSVIGSKNLSFKSPRFLVRPTPGPTGSQKEFYSNDEKFSTSNNWKASFNWLQSSKKKLYYYI